MDELLLEAQIVVVDFLALCVVAWVLYLSRSSRGDSGRIAEILREVREDSKRLQHYLFVK